MCRLIVHVEGQTEETFVNEVLASHLYPFGYSMVSARLVGNARQRERRGGIKPWNIVKKDILSHLKDDVGSIATTMVDYYALPQDGQRAWPGRAHSTTVAFTNKAAIIEQAIHNDVCNEMGIGFNTTRFVPYVMMHEFEGLLFSDPKKFAEGISQLDLIPEFQAIKDQFSTPEEINDSPETAPSKRILKLFPTYEKPLMGTLGILQIGLESIRRECPFFRGWIERLESIPKSSN